MDEKRYQQLIDNRQSTCQLSIDTVLQLVDKVKPRWERMRGPTGDGSCGPSYVTQIPLPENVILDLVLTQHYDWIERHVEGPHYHPTSKRLIVAEGDLILIDSKPWVEAREVRDLFNLLEKQYQQEEIIRQPPSPARTKGIIDQYLKS